MMVSNRNLLFQGPIFRFHVCFGGCTGNDVFVFWLRKSGFHHFSSTWFTGSKRSAKWDAMDTYFIDLGEMKGVFFRPKKFRTTKFREREIQRNAFFRTKTPCQRLFFWGGVYTPWLSPKEANRCNFLGPSFFSKSLGGVIRRWPFPTRWPGEQIPCQWSNGPVFLQVAGRGAFETLVLFPWLWILLSEVARNFGVFFGRPFFFQRLGVTWGKRHPTKGPLQTVTNVFPVGSLREKACVYIQNDIHFHDDSCRE